MQLNQKIDSSIVTVNNSALAIRSSGRTIHQKNWQPLIKATLGAFYLLLIIALPATACGGGFANTSKFEFANQLFFLPAIATILPYGIPLVAIVVIEAYILYKREDIPYLKACAFTTLANIFYLISCSISAVCFSILFPISLIGSAISAAMCVSFFQRWGYLRNISQRMFIFLVYLFFMGLGFASLFLVESISGSADRTLLYAVTSGILLIGFIFGFVAKGFAIARLLREKRPTLASTVMSMHVASFPIVAIAYSLMKSYRWF
ncbi:hypothetical protein [Argonema antarcticum]|uniref:hypothetical protein n=1 Tax=Argonema antarcticum TaxID=2942763 RepID=UPI002012487B|nr:hypothetical protein [Argonema antarcticum]MCL1470205.1 hypothetical protein [Argonema antarcticum A004/B2]